MSRTDGSAIDGHFTAPCIKGSQLPALMGLQTLIDKRAVIDFGTRQMHFVGPGGVKIDLGSGSSTFQLEHAPSGHLVLPCDHFERYDEKKRKLDDESVALNAILTDTGAASSNDVPS